MQKDEPDGNAVGKKFSFMIQAIRGAVPDDVIKSFTKLPTDSERFAYVWKLKEVHDVIALEKEFEEKSTKRARKHREKGNEYFQKKSYLSALNEYNAAVMAAPVAKDVVDVEAEPGSKQPTNCIEEVTRAEPLDNNSDCSKNPTVSTHDNTSMSEKDKGQEVIAEKNQSEDETKNELALALANRSAALLHMQHYRQCLDDIDLALEFGYPEDTLYKMLERRGRCFQGLHDYAQAISCFNEAKQNSEKVNLKEKTKQTLGDSFEKQIVVCQQMQDVKKEDEGKKYESIRKNTISELAGGCADSIYTNASSKIQLSHSASLGRHFIARENISAGDVLMIEKPFLTVAFPKFYQSHCYQCLSPIQVPIPCTQCCSVAYCGKTCRDQSWTKFHQYECSYFAIFDDGMMGRIGHLSLRLLMLIGADSLLKMIQKLQNNEEANHEVEKDVVYPCDYGSIYHLVANKENRKSEDTFDLVVVSCFVMKLLQLTGFSLPTDLESPEFHKIGGVLLRHLQIAQCNAWPIIELQKPDKFDDLKPEELGIGLYPTAALVNHSCDPPADFCFYQDTLLLRAIRNMRKGEEVAVSYGPVFYEVKTIPRQNQLKKSHLFTCKCPPCKENWPIAQEMFDSAPGYTCTECHAPLDSEKRIDRKYYKCTKCDHKQDMEELVGSLQVSFDTFAEAMMDALSGRSDEALPKFLQHQQLLQRYLRHPWRDLAACQSAVRNCFRLQANVKQ